VRYRPNVEKRRTVEEIHRDIREAYAKNEAAKFERCVMIDNKIEHLRRRSGAVNDEVAMEAISSLIATYQKAKAALLSEMKARQPYAFTSTSASWPASV
jgi:hypothetical protein